MGKCGNHIFSAKSMEAMTVVFMMNILQFHHQGTLTFKKPVFMWSLNAIALYFPLIDLSFEYKVRNEKHGANR